MFEQMEESADRCYAYNKAGQRCEMIAGHDRDHSVIIAWGPDECWTPDRGNGGVTTAIITGPAAERVIAANAACVICDHPMHKGTCRVSEGEFDCDCAEGVA